MNDQNKKPVTLESLLRLKRVERPADEFWGQFDRELRAKQLAAIVEKRPWWSLHPRVQSIFARHRVAIGGVLGGATALSAVLFTFTEFQASAPAPWLAHSAAPAAASAGPAAAPAKASAAPAPAARAAVAPAASGVAPAASADSFEPELASMISSPTAGISPVERSDRGLVFSARPMEANFAALQTAEPGILRNMMALTQGFQSPLIATRSKHIEPLAQMTPPSEERRSRLLAETLPMAGFEATAASVSDRFESRRSDDRLYDSINRYSDPSSDRLTIRF